MRQSRRDWHEGQPLSIGHKLVNERRPSASGFRPANVGYVGALAILGL